MPGIMVSAKRRRGGGVSETPAETLRRAAKLMRERAGAATPGPWFTRSDGDWYVCSNAFGLVSTGIHDEPSMGHLVNVERDHRDAAHIASWHPGVALAIAELLDLTAEAIENIPGLGRGHVDGGPCDDYACMLKHKALTAARIYLGEEARRGMG